MRKARTTRMVTALAVASMVFVTEIHAQAGPAGDATGAIVGDWIGQLRMGPGNAMSIFFRFEIGDDGGLVGRAHSPERSARGLPMSEIKFDGDALRFKLPGGGEYEAAFDGAALDGTWTMSGQRLPLEMRRGEYTSPTESSGATERISGMWTGRLKADAVQLQLILRATASELGTFAVVLDSPDQGATGIPINSVTVDGDIVRFDLRAIAASYEGTFNNSGDEIAGLFTQGGVPRELVFSRREDTVEANRPQNPERPLPYVEEEVTYRNETAGIELAGTLTLPRSDGPFPAVILITGSGAQDRDETVAGHKPFLVLSDYLTRRGLAVLRSDDRGVGGSEQGNPGDTTEDFVTDVFAAFEFLEGRTDIDANSIGLIGHSEGGLVAALAAAESDDIAFVVMLAGSGIPGEEILYSQAEFLLRENGATDEMIAGDRALRAQIFGTIKEYSEIPLDTRLAELRGELIATLISAGMPQVAAAMQVSALIETYSTPWFRFFISYDPATTISRVKSPVLALIGERDMQAPAGANLPAIEAALKAGGNEDYTVIELPELNHLFQTSQTGSPSEYAAIEETFDPGALELIWKWVEARVPTK